MNRVLALSAALAVGCTVQRAAPLEAPLPAVAPVAIDEPRPRVLSLEEIGGGEPDTSASELTMPEGARVLRYVVDQGWKRTTFTLEEAGSRRVLRVRIDEGAKVARAAYAGEATKSGTALRPEADDATVHAWMAPGNGVDFPVGSCGTR